MIILTILSSLAVSSSFPLSEMHIRNNSISNTFGMVRNSGRKAHQGWDLSAKIGDPVFSIAPFETSMSGYHADYGYWVMYRSTKSGYYYFNAHLSRIPPLPKRGKIGDIIGYVGTSGNARNSDPHLHFEMRTKAYPGLGLSGRLSPANTFGSWTLYLTQPRSKTK